MKLSWALRRSRAARWAVALALAGATVLECAEGGEPVYLYESLKSEGLRDALQVRRNRVEEKQIPGFEAMAPVAPVRRRLPALSREAVEFMEVHKLWDWRTRDSVRQAGKCDGISAP